MLQYPDIPTAINNKENVFVRCLCDADAACNKYTAYKWNKSHFRCKSRIQIITVKTQYNILLLCPPTHTQTEAFPKAFIYRVQRGNVMTQTFFSNQSEKAKDRFISTNLSVTNESPEELLAGWIQNNFLPHICRF